MERKRKKKKKKKQKKKKLPFYPKRQMIKPLKMLTYFLLLPYMLPQKHHNLQQSYKVQGIKKQCATHHAKKWTPL
jgi:hypothetical protein